MKEKKTCWIICFTFVVLFIKCRSGSKRKLNGNFYLHHSGFSLGPTIIKMLRHKMSMVSAQCSAVWRPMERQKRTDLDGHLESCFFIWSISISLSAIKPSKISVYWRRHRKGLPLTFVCKRIEYWESRAGDLGSFSGLLTINLCEWWFYPICTVSFIFLILRKWQDWYSDIAMRQ